MTTEPLAGECADRQGTVYGSDEELKKRLPLADLDNNATADPYQYYEKAAQIKCASPCLLVSALLTFVAHSPLRTLLTPPASTHYPCALARRYISKEEQPWVAWEEEPD